ncbi:MAG: LPS assembly protein LptD, partial [Candidatus Methylumidiphilus sp.]
AAELPRATVRPSPAEEPEQPRAAVRPSPAEEPEQPRAAVRPSLVEEAKETERPKTIARPSPVETPKQATSPSEEEAQPGEQTKAVAASPTQAESAPRPTLPPTQRNGEDAPLPQVIAPQPKAQTKPTATAGIPPGAAVQTQAKPGWNCRPGDGKQWDCALSGPDPRGEAHVVGSGGEKASENWAQSTDMTRQDEQRFSSILARMPANPWALSCGKNKYEWTLSPEFMLSDADEALRRKSPLQITSDQAEMVQGETSNYQGGTELVRADQRLYADFVTHNSKSGALNARGDVIYREKGLAFSSDTSFMKLNSDEGLLRNSQFILETVPARGTSRVTHIDSKTKSRYETVTYTTCPPGDQDWLLHATDVAIDKETGRGTAKNAWLEFKGVPFLYTPWMSFPVDNRRKSGLLAPYFGYSKLNGFDFTLPYYLNLAPNYDLTLMPRYLEKRGELLRSDFRYLSGIGKGRLFLDILPWDKIEQKTRGQIGWIDSSRLMDKLTSQVDLHLVSDTRYIQELGNLLAINNTTFLRSFGTLNYGAGELFGGAYTAGLMVDYYQSLDETIIPRNYPYRRMPQLSFTYSREIAGTGLQFQTTAEMTRFDQKYLVNGERLNFRPKISYPFRDAAGYIIPSLALQHTSYFLQNTGANESGTFTRTAPIFSLDSGAYFENEFSLFDSPMQQTLEPRLFYLYVPKVAQPYNYNCVDANVTKTCQGLNFDSAEYDFNFYQLFRENRFAGVDRLSDANNITPALTTRLISQNSGLERLKLSAGKIFYFTDPTVVLNPFGTAPTPTNKDNIVGEAASMLSENWSLRSTTQWNPKYDRLDRQQVVLQYNNFNNNLLNLSYRYRRDPYDGSVNPYPDQYSQRTINQTDISTRLPIGWGWFGIGRWQYDLVNNITVEAMAGLEKETCCWRFSLIGLRYLNGAINTDPASAVPNNAIFFQFELKGLGRFGDQVDNLLLQNFSGYRTDYELPGIQSAAPAN